MDADKLKVANALSQKIGSLKSTIERIKTQKTEWIDFSYGNGSSRSCVCTDLEMIERVRSYLIVTHEAKLLDLENEFANL